VTSPALVALLTEAEARATTTPKEIAA